MPTYLDYYRTPEWVTRPLYQEIWPHLSKTGTILDPCAGDGVLVEPVAPRNRVMCIDIDKEKVKILASKGFHTLQDDFRKTGYRTTDTTLIIGNPPFSQAQAFVQACLERKQDKTWITLLMKLSLLEAKNRYKWWKNMPQRPALRILSARPSFTGDGHSDHAAYAWYIWTPKGVEISPLEWYGWEGE